MKRKIAIIICIAVPLMVTAVLLMWIAFVNRPQVTDPPGLVFPTAEAATEQAAQSDESTADVTSEQPSATAEAAQPTEEPPAETVEQPSQPQTYTMYTSHDPRHYFRLDFNQKTISVEGVYEGETVQLVRLDHNKGVRPEYNGELATAQLTANGAETSILDIIFSSGEHIPINISYDDNGNPQPLITEALARSEMAVAHPLNIPRENAMEYVVTGGDEQSRQAVLEQVRSISEQVCEDLEGEYEKARALAQWVSKNIYYDFVAFSSTVSVETLSISRTLELQRSVCGGFANLYAALCQAQGINCYVAKGSVIQGGGNFSEGARAAASHEWNLLEIDGRYIWVDTLWNTDNAYYNDGYVTGDQRLRYFDISGEYMAVNHRAERVEYHPFFE